MSIGPSESPLPGSSVGAGVVVVVVGALKKEI